LLEKIKEIPEDPTEYSNPKTILRLPFPSLYTTIPNERFRVKKGVFEYMGREKFDELLAEVNKLEYHVNVKLFLYGSIGYGKSYMLAALACLLIRQGRRVVYLPDCRTLLDNMLGYVKAALLLAFGDKPDYQAKILKLKDENDIYNFLEWLSQEKKIYLYFIVDQRNALDPEEGEDGITKKARNNATQCLAKFMSLHFSITSSSANDRAERNVKAKQMNRTLIKVYGGFSEVSKL